MTIENSKNNGKETTPLFLSRPVAENSKMAQTIAAQGVVKRQQKGVEKMTNFPHWNKNPLDKT